MDGRSHSVVAVDPVRELLERHGIAATSQRLKVGRLLFARDQHLTAEQVIAALRGSGARVSKATVYNTLNLFARKGLLRVLNVDPERCSFDTNTAPHFHVQDVESGGLTDVPQEAVEFARLPPLPPGAQVLGVDLLIRVRRQG